MGFAKKILNILNMDNWYGSPKSLEDKGERSKNLFWDEEPEEEPVKQEKEKKQEEPPKRYEYVLFSRNIDIPTIIGSRNDYMRRDYTMDPKYSEYWSYLHKLWKRSVDLEKIVKNKKFFETLEEFEELMKIIGQYRFKKFIPERERNYYYSKKDEILIEFLERSFKEEYRNALELKTAKGRISRIDHWFLVMNYYRQYLTPNAISVLDALEKKWTGELMPNLLECGE